jgi:PTH1 family peptidyl-tRNA hydrolase
MPDITTILGLGNPGEEYAGTRHNLGYATLDELARRHNLSWDKQGKLALSARWRFAGGSIRLLKPLTFMNLSGDVLRLADAYADSVLAVCDDIHLPVGIIRIRAGGGSGGHRGLESITAALGSSDFSRLRLGAGPAPPGALWSDFVLERFDEADVHETGKMVSEAADAVEHLLMRGIEAAQRRYNRKVPPDEGKAGA